MAPLDDASRTRMKEIYHESVRQLEGALSPSWPPSSIGSQSPSTMGHHRRGAPRRPGQLVGWLTGLFQGIQATLFVQQVTTQRQLEQMRGVGPSRGPAFGEVTNEGRTPYL